MKNKKIQMYIRLILLIVCFILILFVIKFVLGKYQSSATIDPNIETALYVFKEDYQEFNISLTDVYPRVEPFVYKFSIANTDGKDITETYIDYDLNIETTTNLPLTYELFMNQEYTDTSATNIINSADVIADDYGTYFQKLSTDTQTFGFENVQTNVYQLVIYFPERYNDILYQDVIEGITVSVESKQKLSE